MLTIFAEFRGYLGLLSGKGVSYMSRTLNEQASYSEALVLIQRNDSNNGGITFHDGHSRRLRLIRSGCSRVRPRYKAFRKGRYTDSMHQTPSLSRNRSCICSDILASELYERDNLEADH